MKSTSPDQRIGIFVDVQNMFYSAYDCFRGRLNYKKLLDTVRGDRELVRAIAYAMRDGNNQNSFFTMLREVGFEVRTREPRVRPDGSRKGGWDIGIALEAISVAPRLDVVILVSGDADFVDLVHALRARGVRVEVYAFERNVGRELREAADLFVPIGEELIFREGHGEPEPEPAREPKRDAAREPKREAKREPKREPARRSRATFGASINPEAAKEPEPLPGPVVRKSAADADATPAYNTSSFGAGLLNDDLLKDDEGGDDDDSIDEID